MGPLTASGDDVVIEVWAVPGSNRTEIVGLHGDAVRVRVAAAPERGKANAAIAKLLTGRLGRPVELVGGATSRRKRYVAAGIGMREVEVALGLGHREE